MLQNCALVADRVDVTGDGDAVAYKQACERSSRNSIAFAGASEAVCITRDGFNGEEFLPCVHRNGLRQGASGGANGSDRVIAFSSGESSNAAPGYDSPNGSEGIGSL